MALGKPIISNSDLDHLPFWSDFVWTSKHNELGSEALFDEYHNEVRSRLKLHVRTLGKCGSLN